MFVDFVMCMNGELDRSWGGGGVVVVTYFNG
jgi:hypothetical protein